jgi:hypothetical protein
MPARTVDGIRESGISELSLEDTHVEASKNTTVNPNTGSNDLGGRKPEMRLFQFSGLLWAVEYNAKAASIDRGIGAQTVNAMNTLLMTYAALEVLVLESAIIKHEALYDPKDFRHAGILEQSEWYLEADGRKNERILPVIKEVSDNRVALTHSEPDNGRTFKVGQVISGTVASRFANELRVVANWLWKDERPTAVSSGFDAENVYLRESRR